MNNDPWPAGRERISRISKWINRNRLQKRYSISSYILVHFWSVSVQRSCFSVLKQSPLTVKIVRIKSIVRDNVIVKEYASRPQMPFPPCCLKFLLREKSCFVKLVLLNFPFKSTCALKRPPPVKIYRSGMVEKAPPLGLKTLDFFDVFQNYPWSFVKQNFEVFKHPTLNT